MTCRAAVIHSMKVRHPVNTILPLVKSNTVHVGLKIRMVIAANFCFSCVLLGSRRCMLDRSKGVTLHATSAVPTRLCILVIGISQSCVSGDRL